MTWRTEQFPDLVRSMALRPKHEGLRAMTGLATDSATFVAVTLDRPGTSIWRRGCGISGRSGQSIAARERIAGRTAKRRAVRAALEADGVAAEIEALVAGLLP